MPKLTKSIVDAAPPREKQFTVWCSEFEGLIVSGCLLLSNDGLEREFRFFK